MSTVVPRLIEGSPFPPSLDLAAFRSYCLSPALLNNMNSNWTSPYVGQDNVDPASISPYSQAPVQPYRHQHIQQPAASEPLQRTTRQTTMPIKASLSLKRKASTVGDESSEGETDQKRNKLGYQRSTIACVNCRKRKIRCMVSTQDTNGKCAHCSRLKKDCAYEPVDQTVARGRKRRELLRKDAQTSQSTVTTTTPAHKRRESNISIANSLPDLQPSLVTTNPFTSSSEGLALPSYAFAQPTLQDTSTYLTNQTSSVQAAQYNLGAFSQGFEFPAPAVTTSRPSIYSTSPWSTYPTSQMLLDASYSSTTFDAVPAGIMRTSSVPTINFSSTSQSYPSTTATMDLKDILAKRASLNAEAAEFLPPSLPEGVPRMHRSNTISFPTTSTDISTLDAYLSPPMSEFMSAGFTEPRSLQRQTSQQHTPMQQPTINTDVTTSPSFIAIPPAAAPTQSYISPPVSETMGQDSGMFPSPAYFGTTLDTPGAEIRAFIQELDMAQAQAQAQAQGDAAAAVATAETTSFPWPTPFEGEGPQLGEKKWYD